MSSPIVAGIIAALGVLLALGALGVVVWVVVSIVRAGQRGPGREE